MTELDQNRGEDKANRIRRPLSRRSLMKRAAIGVATVPPIMAVKLLVHEGTEKATGYRSGNAGHMESKECRDNSTSEICQQEKTTSQMLTQMK